MQNILVGGVAIALGGVTLIAAPSLMGRGARAGFLDIQSAAFFPQWAALGLTLAGIAVLASGARAADHDGDRREPDGDQAAAPMRLIAVVALLIALPFTFELIGMPLSLGVAILCLGLVFDCRQRLLLVLISVALPATLDVALRRLLYVLMPEASLW
jgi:hypothetical protein